MPTQVQLSADFCVGAWVVRPSLSRIERGDVAVHLTPRAMSVLVHLGAARGAVVTRNALLDAVWSHLAVTPDALTQCIAELRRAFGDDSRRPQVLETIPRVGVRLLAPVTSPAVAAAPLPRPAASVPVAPTAVSAAAGAAAHAPRHWRPWAAAFAVAAVVIAAVLTSGPPRLTPSASTSDQPGRVAREARGGEAYELYLTARHFRERGDFRRAVLYAQQAVAADTSFGLAHAELAAALTYQDTPFTDPERRARADVASQRAVELDPTSAEAHALRAGVLWELGNFTDAQRYVSHALELDASDPQAQQSRSFLLMGAGRVEEALAVMLAARGKDPLSPNGQSMVGQWQYLAGQTDAAIESLERALELAPEHTGARRALALAYFEKGRDREAIEQYLRLPIADDLKDVLRATLTPEGSHGAAPAFLGEALDAYCANNGLMAAEVLAHYAAEEPMLGCLRDAVAATPYPDLTVGFWMKTSPVFAAYRSDQRFAEVLRASGLPY
jgi:DNA-binding winged helix-turn-helix (wHTH) protein/Flp pilus assembly protein TadD